MTPNELFQKNQKLVYKCLKTLRYPRGHADDLIQEGLIGLWEAAQRFDSERGVQFSTFAWAYIRGRMMKYCRDQVCVVRLPRRAWDNHEVDNLQFLSLDSELDDSPNAATLANLIPGEPDFYPNLFDDQIDDFLATLPDGKFKSVCEEFAYGSAYGDRPNQKELARKYNITQPQISRYRKKFLTQFESWLNQVDEGGD